MLFLSEKTGLLTFQCSINEPAGPD